MSQAYRDEAVPVADVQGAYSSTDLTHFVRSMGSRTGGGSRRLPWLDIVCHRGALIGYGDDPNRAGAWLLLVHLKR